MARDFSNLLFPPVPLLQCPCAHAHGNTKECENITKPRVGPPNFFLMKNTKMPDIRVGFRGFCRRNVFFFIFVGKKCADKFPKILEENPRHISAEGPGQLISIQFKSQETEVCALNRFH